MYTTRLSDRYSRCGIVMQQPQNGRITRDNLVTLRAAAQKEDKLRKLFNIIGCEIGALFSSLLHVLPEKKNSMCKYYGHVIRGSWSGHLPKCADCGCTVHNASELRKAMPVS